MNLPIRMRLTAWYAALLALIILGLGTFVVLQLRSDLQENVDREVEEASVQIARGYALEGPEDFIDVSRTVLSRTDSGSQILDANGRILHNYGHEVTAEPIAPAKARADALAGDGDTITVRLGASKQDFRARVTPVRRLGRQHLLVVAESLQRAEDSVHRVFMLLLLAGPAALLATAAGGWWLARKALRPVERMTAKASEIGIDRLDERVAVPRTEDEIGRLAATLNAMLDRLERGVKEKHQLIADASHELRTPLAVMRSELDVSLRGDDLSPEARAVLESASEEVDSMGRTVENLLTLARVDEGRLQLLKSRVDLMEAVEAAAGPLRSLAAAKDVSLEIEGEPCETEADAHRLQQAIRNFIENAIKFNLRGGSVHVQTWCRDDEVGVTVTDNGPGIPVEAREHIFDRFYRVDSARGRNGGGSGLGLAICREIAVAHGGHVSVESEVGKGSRFTFALPGRAISPIRKKHLTSASRSD